MGLIPAGRTKPPITQSGATCIWSCWERQPNNVITRANKDSGFNKFVMCLILFLLLFSDVLLPYSMSKIKSKHPAKPVFQCKAKNLINYNNKGF
ncbi:hypothetical protein FM107_14580 [Sphingobacterium sp. JB170]|nr:hypothetical protein FM107_14580 [Sphingobacterium sp. JB170]